MTGDITPYFRYSSLPTLRDEFFKPIESLFDSMMTDFFSDFKPFSADTVKGRIYPKVDVFKDGSNIVIEAAVPFVKPEDLKVELQEEMLVISGAANTEQEVRNRQYYKRELSRSAFQRSFPINHDLYQSWVERSAGNPEVDAQIKNGILTVTLKDILQEEAPKGRDPTKTIDIRVIDS
jgi:HSP20 family protein